MTFLTENNAIFLKELGELLHQHNVQIESHNDKIEILFFNGGGWMSNNIEFGNQLCGDYCKDAAKKVLKKKK